MIKNKQEQSLIINVKTRIKRHRILRILLHNIIFTIISNQDKRFKNHE